ncbi:MAG: Cytochrome c heme lyase subunit CcmF [uncultured Thermomicrobiales bacterium]|uniref:Cytochrome c heme lyase subunit CcmF n=1 Tax=uncultured Thermomicrobiales bacterium TaxID=1645740 RepID=A0A6J4VAK7_9BACT|nr:MAG: Cytochrome c heme lyase subunit CcmF [uncultured Thermomicrobiales bacterium]
MADIGQIAVFAAFLICCFGVWAAIYGGWRGAAEFSTSARHAVIALAALLAAASGILVAAFLTHDFGVAYVAEHSSRSMPAIYVGAAFYSGMEGSLLYWATTLGLLGAAATLSLWRTSHGGSRIAAQLLPGFIACLLAIEAFFTFLMAFVARPFATNAGGVVPPDGAGLNPLLRDWGMLIHPPMLLAGYMSWTIPFCFAIAALVSGRVDNAWLPLVRRWTLFAWALLGFGNLLGAWWAYHVLGWGGYWGWDPVENCAIMPWLTGTAFLHSIQVQERRGTLKIWNMALVTLTFCLAIFGTFIVRSGVLQSVHAFALSSIGPYYFAFLAVIVIGSVALLFWRMPALRAERDLDSLLSREAAFLLNNLLFIAVTFAIFWGTIFPLISEAIRDVKVSVGAPYFQMVNGPILLGIVLLMGIGPLLPWRRATRRQLGKAFLVPLVVALGLTGILFAVGIREAPAVVGVFCCLFVAATIVAEFVAGARARRAGLGEGYATAVYGLLRRNGRRYGGYIIHLGIVALALGVLGSQVYQEERQVTLAPGQTAQIGRYTVQLQDRIEYVDGDRRVDEARLNISDGDKTLGQMRPNKAFYRGFENQATTSVAIRTNAREDLYIVLTTWDSKGATLLLVVNPLVVWLWIGGAIVLVGTVFTMWPRPATSPVRVAAPARGEAMAYGD